MNTLPSHDAPAPPPTDGPPPQVVTVRLDLEDEWFPDHLAHRLLVVSDFTGCADPRPVEDRKALHVCSDNLDRLRRGFRADEAAAVTWRGLQFLVSSAPAEVKLDVLNCSLEDLIEDVEDSPTFHQSGLRWAAGDSFGIHPALCPYAAVVLALDLEPTEASVGLLHYLADFASVGNAPVVVGAGPELARTPPPQFHQWRRRAESPWVGLCAGPLRVADGEIHGGYGVALRLAESLATTGTGMAFGAPPPAGGDPSPELDRFVADLTSRSGSSLFPAGAFSARLLLSRIAHYARASCFRKGGLATLDRIIPEANDKLAELASDPPGLAAALGRRGDEVILTMRFSVAGSPARGLIEKPLELLDFADSAGTLSQRGRVLPSATAPPPRTPDRKRGPAMWCVVGNIVERAIPNQGGRATHRAFRPGAKVFCLPQLWGDGCETIQVMGRARGSKGRNLTTIVIDVRWVGNARTKLVRAPYLVEAMWPRWTDQEDDRRLADRLVARLNAGTFPQATPEES